MKKYYLSYNSINRHYYLDCGVFDRNRMDLGGDLDSKIICDKLKYALPLHRELTLYLENSLDSDAKSFLNNFFRDLKNARVKIKYVEDLKNMKRSK
jgi:hypothetical protein